jgi:hypothetical protein
MEGGVPKKIKQGVKCLRCTHVIKTGHIWAATTSLEGGVYCQECVFKLIDMDIARPPGSSDPVEDEIMSRVADRIYQHMRP